MTKIVIDASLLLQNADLCKAIANSPSITEVNITYNTNESITSTDLNRFHDLNRGLSHISAFKCESYYPKIKSFHEKGKVCILHSSALNLIVESEKQEINKREKGPTALLNPENLLDIRVNMSAPVSRTSSSSSLLADINDNNSYVFDDEDEINEEVINDVLLFNATFDAEDAMHDDEDIADESTDIDVPEIVYYDAVKKVQIKSNQKVEAHPKNNNSQHNSFQEAAKPAQRRNSISGILDRLSDNQVKGSGVHHYSSLRDFTTLSLNGTINSSGEDFGLQPSQSFLRSERTPAQPTFSDDYIIINQAFENAILDNMRDYDLTDTISFSFRSDSDNSLRMDSDSSSSSSDDESERDQSKVNVSPRSDSESQLVSKPKSLSDELDIQESTEELFVRAFETTLQAQAAYKNVRKRQDKIVSAEFITYPLDRMTTVEIGDRIVTIPIYAEQQLGLIEHARIQSKGNTYHPIWSCADAEIVACEERNKELSLQNQKKVKSRSIKGVNEFIDPVKFGLLLRPSVQSAVSSIRSYLKLDSTLVWSMFGRTSKEIKKAKKCLDFLSANQTSHFQNILVIYALLESNANKHLKEAICKRLKFASLKATKDAFLTEILRLMNAKETRSLNDIIIGTENDKVLTLQAIVKHTISQIEDNNKDSIELNTKVYDIELSCDLIYAKDQEMNRRNISFNQKQ